MRDEQPLGGQPLDEQQLMDDLLNTFGTRARVWTPDWPEPPELQAKGEDAALELYKSQLGFETKFADDYIAMLKFRRELDDTRATTFWGNLTTIATGVVERARASADLVLKAAAAIATLYTGALGLVFSASDQSLPLRGMVPVLFLGLAVVLSTVYLAYRPRGLATQQNANPNRPTSEAEAEERFSILAQYADAVISPRLYALRSSVVALAVGLAFLPLAFLAPPSFADSDSGAESTTAAVTPTEWPGDQQLPDGKLGQILYQAQVDETALLRQAERDQASAPAAEDDFWYSFGLLAFGLLVVILVPLIAREKNRPRPVAAA